MQILLLCGQTSRLSLLSTCIGVRKITNNQGQENPERQQDIRGIGTVLTLMTNCKVKSSGISSDGTTRTADNVNIAMFSVFYYITDVSYPSNPQGIMYKQFSESSQMR